jgi:hypothetical protein
MRSGGGSSVVGSDACLKVTIMDKLVARIQETGGITSHDGVSTSKLESFEAWQGFQLPTAHKEFLAWSNGVEAYAGYIRLFGVESKESIDSVWWNQEDCWKFAWDNRCSGYWCFGETAWGDQYCYSIDSLHGQRRNSVYLVDAMSMSPDVISTSFSEFIEEEFLRIAHDPYDDMVRLARKKFGPLDVNDHLVYVPSLLLEGEETIDNVQTMNARAAMICNGDLAVQLDAGPADGAVKGMHTYEDPQGRTRLKLEWA